VNAIVRGERAAPVGAVRALVIGVGNCYRRDDGIGPAAAAEIERQHLPGVRVVISDGDPAGLLEAWAGLDLAIVVDAVRCVPATPGRMHRWPDGPLERGWTASSHGLGIPDALDLGRALDRFPRRMVFFAVEAADLRPGAGLSPAVATSLPDVVAAITAELRGAKVPPGQSGRP
jgi:hydrogenase maturation protease